jgi:2-oxoisovalerate dehydrogenase E1 component
MSNGPQAALVPVATGIALHKKINNLPGIAVSYIGEGTLGEGVLYEAMNLASLYKVPHLIVCENNFYSQSTPQSNGVAGNILDRAKAFDIKTFDANTWDLPALVSIAKEAINYVRHGRPAFLVIRTYRLNPHSKGDDNRDEGEIIFFKNKDVLNKLVKTEAWRDISQKVEACIDSHIAQTTNKALSIRDYEGDQLPRKKTARLSRVKNEEKRMVQALNSAYRNTLEKGAIHIGEDIADPYGGAFKVTKGLSTDFPKTTLNTSISEAAIVGIAIGISLMGTKSFVEIMFGDFMTHTLDQLLNNASKIHHMYAFQASVPLRIRTPMGGKRGYGPTHSQSLEKYFLGIDNVGVVALSSMLDPEIIIEETDSMNFPMIILENKVDYGKYLWQESEEYQLMRENKKLGSLKLAPKNALPKLTIVSYGESARHIADNLNLFFIETDYIPELICITQIHPLDMSLIEQSISKTKKILIVEDGSVEFGFGSEILSRLTEKKYALDLALRIGAEAVPIPSIAELELEILPTINRIIRLVKLSLKG